VDSMSKGNPKLLGDILMEMKCITADQLAQALKVQSRSGEKRRLGEILISRGFIKRCHIDVGLAKQRGKTQ